MASTAPVRSLRSEKKSGSFLNALRTFMRKAKLDAKLIDDAFAGRTYAEHLPTGFVVRATALNDRTAIDPAPDADNCCIGQVNTSARANTAAGIQSHRGRGAFHRPKRGIDDHNAPGMS